ncbi:MAG: glycoside hydrolase family 5 protein [Clostridia bacterium]|nr:glycoside hydrolase family 5 protein [Clostridia bacterium]
MKRILSVLLTLALCLLSIPSLGEEIVIPELDIAAKEIPDNEALRLIRAMKAGWNLGNTFDASNCTWLRSKMDYESAWCGVKTSRELISALKAAGFNTVRVPVSWHNHLSEDWTIDADWLDRVHEVVSWVYEEGMYVILNIHHDDDPAYYYPDQAHLENSEKYIQTIWSQLAARFADFDQHLIFESINEPRLTGTSHEWWWEASNPECQEAMACIVRLNQVFVDTVRATGGNNADRYLMVPAYDANPDYACAAAFTLPEDAAENRIIVSAHAYSPYDFALQQPGIDTFSLDNNSQKAGVSSFLQNLYQRYVSQGVPVLMGEFGAMEKNGNLQSRVDWISWYVAQARARGITCCWWDNNLFEGNGERFGLFNRATAECVNPELLAAFMRYAE